jgi:preprotein translocase subunit SecG
MTFLLYSLHALVCVFLILVVLLQQGKGADLSVFGGGATMTAFGARGAATLLHKLTVGSFVLFIITTLAIGVVASRSGDRSVVPSEPAPAAETPAEKPPALPAALPAEDEDTETPPPAQGASPEAAPVEAPVEAAPVEATPAEPAPPPVPPPGAAEAPSAGGGR